VAGGKDAAYRLSLTTGPFIKATSPSGIKRGHKATLRPIGWNLQSDRIEVDATAVPAGVDHLFIPVPGGETRLRIEVGDGAEVAESTDHSQPTLTPPVNVSGAIASAGEEDHFQFTAKKGERLDFLVRAATSGSPLDAVLRIDDSAGKSLATGDGGTAGDAKLAWTVPQDGVYRATIADLFHNGGAEYLYRLEIKRPAPEVRATVENDAYALVPGKNVSVKVSVSRKNDHAGALVAVVTGLPPGVTATSAEFPANGGGDVSLVLTAAADAKTVSGPLRVLLLGTDVSHPEVVTATLDLRKDLDKPGGQGFIERAAEIWLTLSPTAEAGAKKKPE
jgi:hypothetical protein